MSEQKIRSILNTDHKAVCDLIMEAAQYVAILEFANSKREQVLALEKLDEVGKALLKLRTTIEKIPTS